MARPKAFIAPIAPNGGAVRRTTEEEAHRLLHNSKDANCEIASLLGCMEVEIEALRMKCHHFMKQRFNSQPPPRNFRLTKFGEITHLVGEASGLITELIEDELFSTVSKPLTFLAALYLIRDVVREYRAYHNYPGATCHGYIMIRKRYQDHVWRALEGPKPQKLMKASQVPLWMHKCLILVKANGKQGTIPLIFLHDKHLKAGPLICRQTSGEQQVGEVNLRALSLTRMIERLPPWLIHNYSTGCKVMLHGVRNGVASIPLGTNRDLEDFLRKEFAHMDGWCFEIRADAVNVSRV